MRTLRFTLMLLACAFATGAAAQYPDKPIRLIVPQAAGSATDTVARILGAELAKEIGQQIVVDNRPGGALTIGLDLTAKAEPDGYTLCMGPIGALAITRHMVAKLPYDIERDFQPIALATRGHLLLAVSPTVPFKSVTEIIDYAKKNPGKLMNASSSNGSPGHVGGELFKFMTDTDIVHVPYRGGAARDQRPDRRPRAPDVREPQLDRAARADRAPCARSRSAARGARPAFRSCRRWRKPACPATRRRPGAASSRPPACHGRSWTSSTPPSTGPSRRRPSRTASP